MVISDFQSRLLSTRSNLFCNSILSLIMILILYIKRLFINSTLRSKQLIIYRSFWYFDKLSWSSRYFHQITAFYYISFKILYSGSLSSNRMTLNRLSFFYSLHYLVALTLSIQLSLFLFLRSLGFMVLISIGILLLNFLAFILVIFFSQFIIFVYLWISSPCCTLYGLRCWLWHF